VTAIDSLVGDGLVDSPYELALYNVSMLKEALVGMTDLFDPFSRQLLTATDRECLLALREAAEVLESLDDAD